MGLEPMTCYLASSRSSQTELNRPAWGISTVTLLHVNSWLSPHSAATHVSLGVVAPDLTGGSSVSERHMSFR